MAQVRVIETLLALCAAVLLFGALYSARSILAPVACSLFIIAVVWPFQRRLQARIPKLLALVVTVSVILLVIAVLGLLIVWGFSRIGQWIIANSLRFQVFYLQASDWLEGHGFSIASQMAQSFNVGWLIRIVQEIGGRLQGMISFVIITAVFTVLGLLEVDVTQRNLARLKNDEIRQTLLQAGKSIAAKFQRYMLVRSAMSVMTGAVIWGVALLAGLELATAWGVIAFVFNYIPFIGPLIATVFPTLFALVKTGSWELCFAVFACLNFIQFFTGSYLEPRIAGAALSISPFVVLFAVFFWSFLWGIAGAFIGAPIVIAILAICEKHESTQWIALLLSGHDKRSPAVRK